RRRGARADSRMQEQAMPRKAKSKSAENPVKAYKRGYEAVNQRVLEEARRTPATLKYRQFLSLWRLGEALGWQSPQEKEVDEVRKRWARLRRIHASKEKGQD